MELQGGDTAVVSALTAATARLGNENPLDLPAALRHALLRTTLAAVGAPGVEPETGRTVSQAVLLYLSGCVIGQGWLAPAVAPLDLPAPEPVSNRRNRSIEGLGNLLQACPVAREPFENLSIRSPTRCESFGSRRSEPVRPGPVGDGRRVHAEFPANLFKGLASFELSCQPFPIHEHMFARDSDERDGTPGEPPSCLRPTAAGEQTGRSDPPQGATSTLRQARRRPQAEGRRGEQ
jgi:hypothetical protein